jgi:hypothetical protein
MSFPAPDPNVQLARILGGVADVKQDVEDLRNIVGQVQKEGQHNSGKIDEIHKAIYGNGGAKGLRERVAVLEAVSPLQQANLEGKIENSADVADQKVTHAREVSIDWKFIAMLLIQIVIVGLVAKMTQ